MKTMRKQSDTKIRNLINKIDLAAAKLIGQLQSLQNKRNILKKHLTNDK